jgi:uncharacterized OB-fold protein
MNEDQQYHRPVPVPDEMTAGFWEAVGQHELAFQRCRHCGTYAHPPVSFCMGCHNLDRPEFSFEKVSGRGTIVNWTVIADQMVSGFIGSDPIVHVLVRFAEQEDLLFPATLVGDTTGLALGAPVETVIRDVAPGVSLPYFQLVAPLSSSDSKN